MNWPDWNDKNPFELQRKSISGFLATFLRISSALSLSSVEDQRDLQSLRLADIEIISTLGVGGFGRVELVNETSGVDHLKKCVLA